LPELPGPAKPDTVIDEALPKVVVSATPFNSATDAAVKPVPVTVVEKTPSGSGDVPIDEITGGTLLIRVTVATLCPAVFFAVTVSVPDEGMVAGAEYNPFAVTVPDTADQAVAPAAVNCCVAPSETVAVAGEITGA
jgi:hypothetical protein